MPKKRAKRPLILKGIFDPEEYQELFSSLSLKAQVPEVPNSYLLEQLTKMDPQGTLAKRLKPKDLDGLSMRDRHAVVWQVLEQTSLGMLSRQGEIELLAKEGLIWVELIDWDTYAQRTGGSKALNTFKDLSATDVLLDPFLMGLLQMVLGTVARRTKPGTPPEENSPTAALIYKDIKKLLTSELISDVPGAEKKLKHKGREGDPSATMMFLILRVAMLLHMGFKDPNRDLEALMKGHSIPMFLILYNNNSMYSLWNHLIQGKPLTRFIEDGEGGFNFERIDIPE